MSIAGPMTTAMRMPPTVVSVVASATLVSGYFKLVRIVGSQLCSA